ncbi:MAG: ribosome small subunit-dependent GTPase A [Spirochaetia bacterium]|nr:ribosome small subunit-dependent GTPase A [Spirochaetia bacterium]
MEEKIGIVTRGINNIYTVVEKELFMNNREFPSYMCRIKGKVLNQKRDEYSPLSVGDYVLFTIHTKEEGLITERLERINTFQRWNAKRSINQTIVANMDLIIIVTSTDEPPFRPRFIDRAIVCAGNTPVLIVLNKCDLPLTQEEDERFTLFKKLGFDTINMSAFDAQGIELLKRKIEDKIVAFVGQSGVGKSTIVNELLDGSSVQQIGDISLKFNRGKHTTNHSIMFKNKNITIVDTPGVREILIPHTDLNLIGESFPEFKKSLGKCSFDMCLHESEPDCDIKRRVENGEIDPDRYESYLRMLDSIRGRETLYESDRR